MKRGKENSGRFESENYLTDLRRNSCEVFLEEVLLEPLERQPQLLPPQINQGVNLGVEEMDQVGGLRAAPLLEELQLPIHLILTGWMSTDASDHCQYIQVPLHFIQILVHRPQRLVH